MNRTFTASGDKPVTITLARGLPVVAKDGALEVGPRLVIRATAGVAPKAAANELTLTLKPGESATLGYSFR